MIVYINKTLNCNILLWKLYNALVCNYVAELFYARSQNVTIRFGPPNINWTIDCQPIDKCHESYVCYFFNTR